MPYSEEFLISELHRFVKENSKVPKAFDMTLKNGYPSYDMYRYYFKTWNNALEMARLEIHNTHEKRTGLETCCICGCDSKQKLQWYTKGLPKGKVMCQRCYHDSDYINGNLDKNSNVGFGFISQRVVARTLGLGLKDDCNCSINFGHPFDLYDEGRYNYIDVKCSRLYNNRWLFTLKNKEISDTYILVGFDEERKNILRVWITDPLDDLTYERKYIGITNNTNSGLKRAKPWEVDPKPYNDMLHKMSEKRKETKGKECILSNNDLR